MDHDTRIGEPGVAHGGADEPPIVKNKVEARQGTNRAPMHYVLVGGLALVVIAFVLIYFMH